MRAPVIDNARAIEQPDEGLLFEVSDEALEAAANQTRAVAANVSQRPHRQRFSDVLY